MLPLTEEIFRCDESTLEKLNIKINNKYRSNLVKRLVKDYKADHQAEIHLTLNKDLTFNEDEETAENRLTETEYNILKHLLNNILITREEIAQLKWGTESADKYSYWAINKTISRINNKLKIYKITAIPKVGYQITKNGSIS
jgi:DNA-binding response OmpR family regulator